MYMENTELLFLRLTLANAYDRGDWLLVQQTADTIDAMTIAGVKKSLAVDKDAM